MNSDIPSMGRLEPVDLRQVWASEPYNFTPWLAERQNLQLLAEALALPGLELIQTEKQVSEFSVDVVARIPGTDEIVLIENQLERSDHTHLGQVITYAGGSDASVMVWVSPRFTEGHRAAVDWLNRNTLDNLAFFAVELEAWRIGESLPAPRFNVLVRPNEWARSVRDKTHPINPDAEANLAFWEAFEPFAHKHNVSRGKTNPLKGNNYYVRLWKDRDIWLTAYVSRYQGTRIGAYIGIWGENATGTYEQLLDHRAEIEQAFGSELSWEKQKEGVFWIRVNRSLELGESESSDELLNWLAGTAARLRDAVAAHLPVSQHNRSAEPDLR